MFDARGGIGVLKDRQFDIGIKPDLAEPQFDTGRDQQPIVTRVQRVGIGAGIMLAMAADHLQDRRHLARAAPFAEIVGQSDRSVEFVAGPIAVSDHKGELVSRLNEIGERVVGVKPADMIGANHDIRAAGTGQSSRSISAPPSGPFGPVSFPVGSLTP